MSGYLVSATLGWGGDLQSEFSFRPGHLPAFESNRTLLLTIVHSEPRSPVPGHWDVFF